MRIETSELYCLKPILSSSTVIVKSLVELLFSLLTVARKTRQAECISTLVSLPILLAW